MVQVKRPSLKDLNLNLGKRTRLHRILYEYAVGNGMALILPIDHGLEHGPRDFFANPESVDPAYQLRLAKEGGFSAIVFHIGLAEKYMKEFTGEIPLILKLNGKTSIPPDTHAFSPQTASVEDAVRLGADAVFWRIASFHVVLAVSGIAFLFLMRGATRSDGDGRSSLDAVESNHTS